MLGGLVYSSIMNPGGILNSRLLYHKTLVMRLLSCLQENFRLSGLEDCRHSQSLSDCLWYNSCRLHLFHGDNQPLQPISNIRTVCGMLQLQELREDIGSGNLQ